MELRSAARADTQIYVIGLDVGGMAMEVAQRGLSSMLSNRMAHLGQWSFDGARPTLRIAGDLIGFLLERERSSRFERAVVGTAAPVWLGRRERTDLADVIDQRRRHSIVACTTTVAAVVGTSLAGATPLRAELVLSVDLDVGFSASIVEIGVESIHEWCSVGLSPQHVRGENVDSGIVPVARQRERALAELYRQAIELGCADVERAVCVGDGPVDVVQAMFTHISAWAGCPVAMVSGRSAVARGAAFIADPAGGLEVLDRGRMVAVVAEEPTVGPVDVVPMSADEQGHESGGAGGWVVTGSLGRRIGVLMDDSAESSAVHPVVERGAAVPSVYEQLFDLGSEDGSEVYLDLYEQDGLLLSDEPSEHHVFATANFRDGVRRRPEVTVTFELGVDGRFAVGPQHMWAVAWRPAEVDVLAVQRRLVEAEAPDDRVMIRPAIASWSASPAADDVAPESTSRDVVPVEQQVGVSVTDEPEASRPEESNQPDQPEQSEQVAPVEQRAQVAQPEESEAPDESGEPREPALVTPSVAALVPTPAIATALQRCERLLSSEVGQMVAVRSVFALLDRRDDASPEEVEAAAVRLEASVSGRADDLADAIRVAITATRRSIANGFDDWYFGGTLADVARELGRVVEHLMVVVGLVSAAEQRRLVLDAQLLGLDREHAHDVVRDLVVQVQENRAQAPLRHDDEIGSVVHLQLNPQLGRFVLDEPRDGGSGSGADVRVRVLLDVI